MKNIIVTGCAGGIGYATAKKFLQNGYAVTGMDIVDGHTVAEKFSEKNFTYVRGDLSRAEDRAELIRQAVAAFGGIYGLVNVAGVAPKVRNDLLEMTEESYDFVMNINTKGALFLTQAVAKEMINNPLEDGVKGVICNISSMSAYTSSVSRGEYCISKAGVSMITKLFADRLAEYGIPVNEVRPGIIATGMTEKVKDKYDAKIADGLVPTGRWGYPEDVAKAVGALVDGTFAYTTGESFIVDGGLHIRKL